MIPYFRAKGNTLAEAMKQVSPDARDVLIIYTLPTETPEPRETEDEGEVPETTADAPADTDSYAMGPPMMLDGDPMTTYVPPA